MTPADSPKPTRTVLTKQIRATPQRVYDTCTKPELLALWLGPTPLTATDVEADVVVGGQFLFRLSGANGNYAAAGTYLELAPPRRIVMTWAWVEAPDLPRDGDTGPESTVTITIDAASHGSTLTLMHADLPDDEAATEHGQGWADALTKLARLFGNSG